jgi:rubrerythrin
LESYEDFAVAAVAVGSLETLDVDAMRVMYRVEMAGEMFYERIAAGVDNDEAAQLLLRNGREERGHAERIRRAIGIKLGRPYEPAGVDLEPLAVNLPEMAPLDLLPGVVDGEIAGDAGYQRWAANESDPAVQRLLRQNGREETRHSKRVAQAIEILERAAG